MSKLFDDRPQEGYYRTKNTSHKNTYWYPPGCSCLKIQVNHHYNMPGYIVTMCNICKSYNYILWEGMSKERWLSLGYRKLTMITL